MISFKKNLLFLTLILFCLSLTTIEAKRGRTKKMICNTEEDCVDNKNCKCYCSRMCGFREKETDDNPVYIKNDPNGKHCYCKQWDLDNYENRCMNGGRYEERSMEE